MHKKKECTRKNQLSTKPIPRKLKYEKKPISIKPVKSDKDSAEGMDFLHDVMHVHHTADSNTRTKCLPLHDIAV